MDRRRTSARVNEPRTAGGVAVLDEVFVPSDFVPSEAIFAEVDVDRSGRISFQEFAAWWGGRQQALATGDENEVLEGARALEGVSRRGRRPTRGGTRSSHWAQLLLPCSDERNALGPAGRQQGAAGLSRPDCSIVCHGSASVCVC